MRLLVTYLLSACGLLMATVHAQPAVEAVKVVVQGTDTMPWYVLQPVHIEADVKGKARRAAARADRLTRYVQKVYPYAQITASLLAEYDRDLASIARKGDQELYLKLAEAELRAEFEQEIKGLTVTQGRILVKLIDRETGHTGYELVRQLKGSFQAWMWQGIAQLFGNDLKGEYDPHGDDRLVESIVRRIENGELAVTPRAPRTDRAIARLEKRKTRLYKKYGMALPAEVSQN